MPPTTPAFGRRRAAPVETAARQDASPQDAARLEAFRREVASGRAGQAEGFAAWRAEQRPRRLMMWLASFALMAPGAIGLLVEAPWHVSAGLEVAGLALGWWLRSERRRHLGAITAWSEDAPI